MNNIERLCEISNELKKASDIDLTDVDKLLNAALRVAESSSQSWIGYQSLVYYKDFIVPPSGAHFSIENGFDTMTMMVGIGTRGDWKQYSQKEVLDRIIMESGNVNIDEVIELCSSKTPLIQDSYDELLSIFQLGCFPIDDFVTKIRNDIEGLKPLSKTDVIKIYTPKQIVTRDQYAREGGCQTPPHYLTIATCLSVKCNVDLFEKLGKLYEKLAKHLQLQIETTNGEVMTKGNIFIGHGNSEVWREFKDFIQDRLQLKWDEFNRVPIAGKTNISRLSEMLNQASFAFLIMTAEDKTPEGKLNARLNVVHEAGLFQGKLGFDRAIILLEEGCEEFSNIHGLGQIRFSKGNIKSAYEDVRRTLISSGLLGGTNNGSS